MPLPSRPYPVNLLVAGRSVLVVGGGAVALEKVDGLLDAEAAVTVVAPEVVPELVDRPGVRVERRPYRSGEAAGVLQLPIDLERLFAPRNRAGLMSRISGPIAGAARNRRGSTVV